ncbi:hypothetical protein C2E23DRAFT_858268 [Lenzites betulinus]|nr:hypothetical protein C2E23DRAFT_858268 [Lenzites betulinus]
MLSWQGTPLPLYSLSSSPPVTAAPSYMSSGVENQPYYYTLPGSAYGPPLLPMLLMIPSGARAFSITFEPKELASSSAFNRAALVDFSANGSGVSPRRPDSYPTQNPNGQRTSAIACPQRSQQPQLTSPRRKTFYSSELHRVKMYSIKREFMEWYESHGEQAHPAPPAPIRKLIASCPHAVRTGRLHLHRHDGGVQAWMWVVLAPECKRGWVKRERGEARWVEVEAGETHPRMEGHVLHFLDNGETRWVKELTASQYAAQAGRRKRARAAVGRGTEPDRCSSGTGVFWGVLVVPGFPRLC